MTEETRIVNGRVYRVIKLASEPEIPLTRREFVIAGLHTLKTERSLEELEDEDGSSSG